MLFDILDSGILSDMERVDAVVLAVMAAAVAYSAARDDSYVAVFAYEELVSRSLRL